MIKLQCGMLAFQLICYVLTIRNGIKTAKRNRELDMREYDLAHFEHNLVLRAQRLDEIERRISFLQ